MKVLLTFSFVLFFSSNICFPWRQIDSAKEEYKSGNIKNVLDYHKYFNRLQPKETRQESLEHIAAFAYESRSELPASLENPRIFRFFLDTTSLQFFLGTYPKDPSVPVVQFLEFNKVTNLFDWAEYDQRTNSFRESPSECLSCHKGPNGTFKPIWGAYPEWIGMLGGIFNGNINKKTIGTSKLKPPLFEKRALWKLYNNRKKDPYLAGMNFGNNYYQLASNLDIASGQLMNYNGMYALEILEEAAKKNGKNLRELAEKITPKEISLHQEIVNVENAASRMKTLIDDYAKEKIYRFQKIVEKNSTLRYQSKKFSYRPSRRGGVNIEDSNGDIFEFFELSLGNLYYIDALITLANEVNINFLELIPGFRGSKYPVLTGGENTIESYAQHFSLTPLSYHIKVRSQCGMKLR